MQEEQIPTTTMWLMIGTAIFYDIFQFVMNTVLIAGTILAWLVSICAFLTFWIWFKLYGKSFMKPSRFLAMGAGVIIEMVPVLDALPGWTVAVIFLVGIERAQMVADKLLGEGSIASKAIQAVKKTGK